MKILICLLIFGFAHSASAGADYEQSIDLAIQSGAATNTQWLRLGHWKYRPLRRLVRPAYRSEADSPEFFISKNGAYNPESELRATLRAFAQPLTDIPNQDEAQHPQCLYPARFRWALEKIGWKEVMLANQKTILPCRARQAWKKQLDAEGISLVFASAYLNNAASMFGHTFLKFHSRGNGPARDLLDYGVNFAAETGADGGIPYAIFGLGGFYPGRFSMQPFHQTLRTYANLEGRDLIEYRLAFTPEEIDFFVDHLFELERTYFDYYFLSENCSYFLLAALETAKPEISLSDEFWYEVIPADTVRIVARTPGLVTSTKYRPALTTIFRSQAAKLSYRDIMFAKNAIDEQKMDGIENVSTAALDLAIDYGGVRALSGNAFDTINHRLRAERARRGGSSNATKLEIPRRPEEGHDPARLGVLYELPTDAGARGRLGLQLRLAYHDRLSNDDGYLRGTTLEVFRMTAFNDDRDPQRIRFREFAILDILSTQPRDPFSQPYSWRASFGFREPLGSKSLGPYFNGGFGATFEFGRFLWVTGLLNAEALSNPDLESRTPIHAGPKLIATAFLHRDLKFGVDASWMRALIMARHYDTVTSELAWAPTRNFELRLGHTSSSIEGDRRNEWSAKIYQHLLF